ncbi:AraC family transcriptional regulator [Salinicoccus sediminis]|uniref:AraC family transcriptional regulator n=1 Tax=Salinicoccus sediminis TaxID=1432562 RepID=A0A0M2SLS7_9STAP|nr:AraC family transcriptional regulator [Salinicoccus sediminis]KKK33550.1 AraC family transcriptional regulator [Salinicoccus sediminis]
MDNFIYKKAGDITALSARLDEFTYKKHSHHEYAIGVTLKGIQEYDLEGSRQLSHPEGVMFFNPEQIHDGKAHDETGLEYVMLYIEPELLMEASEIGEMFKFTNPVIYNRNIRQKVLNLSNSILTGRDEAVINELFLNLSDSFAKKEIPLDHYEDDLAVKDAKDILHSIEGNTFRLEEVSSLLNLSKFQFIRKFKAQTGITPYQYFLNSKVEQARKSLERNNDIYQTVAECGFFDLTHLNRHFKSIYGITAYDYVMHLKSKK